MPPERPVELSNDRDDLFNRRWVSRVLLALVARRTASVVAGIVARERRWPATSSSMDSTNPPLVGLMMLLFESRRQYAGKRPQLLSARSWCPQSETSERVVEMLVAVLAKAGLRVAPSSSKRRVTRPTRRRREICLFVEAEVSDGAFQARCRIERNASRRLRASSSGSATAGKWPPVGCSAQEVTL